MIFVTVGTDIHGFERLAEAMDCIAADIDDDVVMQLGHTEYRPDHADWFQFTATRRIETLRADAQVIVAHAGAGTLIEILRSDTPAVVVPRRAKYDEHVNDHQLELVNELEERENLFMILEINELRSAIEQAKGAEGRIRDSTGQLPTFLDQHLEEL